MSADALLCLRRAGWEENALSDLSDDEPVAQAWADLSNPASGHPLLVGFSQCLVSADDRLFVRRGTDANKIILRLDDMAKIYPHLQEDKNNRSETLG